MPDTPRKLRNKAHTADLFDSSEATVDRWRENPAVGFPEPVNIHNKLFWYEDELLAWMQSRPRVSQRPTVLQDKRKRIEANPATEAR
jgi:predicted DNA-binding transcriptional regulator AlpA